MTLPFVMRRGSVAIAVSFLAGVGCAHGPAPNQAAAAATPQAQAQSQAAAPPGEGAGEAGKTEIQIDFGAAGGGTMHAAALVYGLAKAAARQAHPPPAVNQSGDDFEIELEARSALLEFWAGRDRKAGERSNAALDREVQIWREGLLPELVIMVYGRPGWTIPGKTVSALRFDALAKRFAGSYEPVVLAAIKPPSGKLVPDVPGADFPDPESLSPGTAICGEAQPQRRQAWQRWEALEPRLGGMAVAGENSREFARQLAALKDDARRAGRAVTWVSARVAVLAWLEGFCAVEARDWKRAAPLLERAISLAPDHAGPRLELSVVLAELGRLRESLRLADHVIATTDDGCMLARAWRRRGYVLVELDALGAARRAYERSLEINPGNPIALKELETIASAVQQHKAVRELTDVGVDPSQRIVVTACKPSQKPETDQ